MAPTRPEIQALRAVAVLLVVVYHLWPEALPGGFVGVDVFFAISGFLITAHLVREIDRTGSVSLSAFWARRARRILPAALTVLLACTAATLLVVPPTHWQQFLAEVHASALYVQNWRLAADAVDYLAASNGPSPVQHFWSLSVEEQFYLVWPVLLLGAATVTRHRSPRTRRRAVALVVSAVSVAGLVYSVRVTAQNPAAAYFVTPARAWEFGAGGLLALLRPAAAGSVALRSAVSWAGIAAILLAARGYSSATAFPGHAALLPTGGALALIWAGAPAARWAPTRILALRPLQLLGDISYSVYLWHLPLLVLAPFVTGGGSIHPRTRIAIFMLILIAAWLTKILVEDPVRTGSFLIRRPARWTFAFSAAATALVMSGATGGTLQLQQQIRTAERVSQRILAEPPRCFGAAARDPEHACRNPRLRLSVVPTPIAARNRPNAPCTRGERRGLVSVCAFGAPSGDAVDTIALIGDSHASHWRAALEGVARAKRWHGVSIARSGCPFTRAVKVLRRPQDRADCLRWNREVLAWLGRHPEVSTVFVSQIAGSSWVAPRGQDEFDAAVDGFARAWRAAPRSVRHIVVIRDTPKAELATHDCVQRAMAARRPAGSACALPRRAVLQRDPAAVAVARLRSRRVQSADLTEHICDHSQCFPVVGGALVYKDEHHLTAVFAATLAPFLLRKVDALARSWG